MALAVERRTGSCEPNAQLVVSEEVTISGVLVPDFMKDSQILPGARANPDLMNQKFVDVIGSLWGGTPDRSFVQGMLLCPNLQKDIHFLAMFGGDTPAVFGGLTYRCDSEGGEVLEETQVNLRLYSPSVYLDPRQSLVAQEDWLSGSTKDLSFLGLFVTVANILRDGVQVQVRRINGSGPSGEYSVLTPLT